VHRKLLLKAIVILCCLAFHSLSTQAGTFQPQPGSTVLADSIIAAIERGDSIIIHKCKILGGLLKKGIQEKPEIIKSVIDIESSTFWNSVSFKDCYFISLVILYSDTLIDDIDFSRSEFKSDVSFYKTVFKSNVDFHFVKFGGKTVFTSTIFNERADFSFCTFGGDVYFWNAIFKEQAVLLSIEFTNIYISWNQLKHHLICEPRTSYKFMKYFEEQRVLGDADGVYLFLKDQERMEKSRIFRYLEYWLYKLPFGYGAKPLNTLYFSIIIVIVFALFYVKPNAIKEIEKEFWHRKRQRLFQNVTKGFWKRFYNALYFSVHTFIIGIVSNWHPTDEFLINTRRIKLFKFRTLSMIEGVLGWILLAVFIVILTRKFIR
jgi:hypothetical protein